MRITRAGWDEALANAVLTSPEHGVYADTGDWRRSSSRRQLLTNGTLSAACVARRYRLIAFRSSLSRQIIERYVNEWTMEIRDCTPLAHKVSDLVAKGRADQAQKLLPRERVYPVEAEVARRLRMEM